MKNKELAIKLEKFLFNLSSAVRNRFKEEIKNHEDRITEQQFKVLMVIRRRQPCKTSELSDAFSVSPGSMSIMINSLVDEGYIERLHPEEDRRVILLKLTDRGEFLVGEIYERIILMLETLVTKLSGEERDNLDTLLEKLQKMVIGEQKN